MKNSNEKSGNECWNAAYDDFDGYKQQGVFLDKDTDCIYGSSYNKIREFRVVRNRRGRNNII